MKKARMYALLFFALASTALSLLAIETGEIRGRVVDEQGAAIPGVEVLITGPSLQGSRTALSGRTGDFQAPLLPVGHYTLRLRLEGFAPVVQENVIVRLGQVTNLTVTMRLAAEAKEVVVVAQAPLIDKTASDTSFHITSDDLQNLPAQNRTVVDAVKYAPGVVG
ncbi:MAG: carboxypeptidase-like regulatory domain-containing protein, partial [Candidatus Aminicenantes bacterium]|nr:carboxypeptidase-like regulatory domain-containing protein [Candidatus Aminicenantes bacterium]